MAGQEILLTAIIGLSTLNNTDNTDLSANSSRKLLIGEIAEELRGKKLVIATTQNYPLNYAKEENGTLVGGGVAFDFIELLKKRYGFNYTVIVPEQDVLGDDTNGIFGLLNTQKADMAAAFLPVLREGQKYVQYSRNLDNGEWVVLMRRPKESAQGSGLLAPFTLDVWLLVLLSLCVVGPSIYLLILLRNRLCPYDDANKLFPLPHCVWFVYGALLKQGSTLSPVSDSARLLFATWWIFITILTAFYTANLTAFLTLSEFKLPINKPEDITKYKWVTRKGNAVENAAFDTFETNTRVQEAEFSTENNTYILENYVLKKDYLFLNEKPIVDHLMYSDYLDKARKGVAEQDRCVFVITKWSVITRARAFAYSKNFKFAEIFDHTLQYLVEAGIVKHQLTNGLPNTEICPLNLGSKERQLRNSDLFTTYVVIFMGFGISGTVFIGEIVYRYKNKLCCSVKLRIPDNPKLDNGNYNNYNYKQNIKKDNYFNNYYNNYNGSYGIKKIFKDAYDQAPPPYHVLFGQKDAEKKIVNGREYWIIKSYNGETRLIPIRQPSALLFQYTQ